MSKTAELRDKTVEELRSSVDDLKRELFNLRFQVVTGEIQNPRRIREARHEIARINTVIGEKESQGTDAPAETSATGDKGAKGKKAPAKAKKGSATPKKGAK